VTRSGFPTWPFSSRIGLAGVLWFALVLIESRLNLPFGLVLLRQVGLELRVTGFADADCFAWVSFYDPKIAFRHEDSFRQGRLLALWFQTAPLPYLSGLGLDKRFCCFG
jgi:hypothetical protein